MPSTTTRRRIQAIQELARAGIPVGVNVAPVIPGLSDQDIPKILTAAAEAGARSAGMVMVRLPGSVKQVFEERIRAALPLQAERILHRVREVRGGKLYDSRWGTRGRGEGLYADATRDLFRATCQKLGLSSRWGQQETAPREDPGAPTTFRRPPGRGGQLALFDY